MNKDTEQLGLLGIFYYIFAVFGALFSLIFSIYIILGVVMVADPKVFTSKGQTPPPEAMGWIFIGLGIVVILFGLIFAWLFFLTARSLRSQKRYKFCFVMSILSCLSVPLGTILGIFTLVVLSRETVKEIFEKGPPALEASPASG